MENSMKKKNILLRGLKNEALVVMDDFAKNSGMTRNAFLIDFLENEFLSSAAKSKIIKENEKITFLANIINANTNAISKICDKLDISYENEKRTKK